jgi:hypothetical protein
LISYISIHTDDTYGINLAPEGKKPLGRPWHRWENTIRMGLTEIGWGGVDWVHLV